MNDFENDFSHWNQNKKNISNGVFYEGSASNKVAEYSSTFEYSTDLLKMDDVEEILISCSAYCNYSDKTESNLVISIEDVDGIYVWDGKKVNEYIKAYSNWWLIKHEVVIKRANLKEDSKIKVYLWNIEKKEAYLDNFEVEIFGY